MPITINYFIPERTDDNILTVTPANPVGPMTYELSGEDAHLFEANADDGVSFKNIPDFENPDDYGQDHVYNLNVTAHDDENSYDFVLIINLEDLNDNAPVFTSGDSLTVQENLDATVYTAAATDADAGGTITYGLKEGVGDAEQFNIDANTGEVTFKNPPDFENPTDADGDNLYELIVTASDGSDYTTNQAVTITLSNENDNAPVFSSAAAATLSENQTAAYTAAATDADGDSLTYSLSGADSALFSIDSSSGALTFNNAPDFENPTDAGADNDYDLIVTASDGVNSVDQDVTISVLDITPPTTTLSIEGISEDSTGSININATLSAALQDNEILEYSNDNGLTFINITDSINGTTVTYEDGDLTSTNIIQFRVAVEGEGEGEVASQLVTITAPTAAIELSDVEQDSSLLGFVINGVDADDRSGLSVSSAGDVNGDGLDDLIIGASRANPNGNSSGESYLVFGKTDGEAVELSELTDGFGDKGFVINGVDADDFSGGSVSSAGDVNADGLDDLIIGASFADPNGDRSGESYVVFGKTDGEAVELSELTDGFGDKGFVINGVDAGDGSGWNGISVSSAGDVNGDGLDDLIIGASWAYAHGNPASGESYVVFGKTDGGAVELSELTDGFGDKGFVINGGDTGDFSGFSVSSAGDVNGDGLDDLIIGAPSGNGNARNYSKLSLEPRTDLFAASCCRPLMA